MNPLSFRSWCTSVKHANKSLQESVKLNDSWTMRQSECFHTYMTKTPDKEQVKSCHAKHPMSSIQGAQYWLYLTFLTFSKFLRWKVLKTPQRMQLGQICEKNKNTEKKSLEGRQPSSEGQSLSEVEQRRSNYRISMCHFEASKSNASEIRVCMCVGQISPFLQSWISSLNIKDSCLKVFAINCLPCS